MAKIIYITSGMPFEEHCYFQLSELLSLKRAGAELIIVPRNPEKRIFHKSARQVIGQTIAMPIINFRMCAAFAFFSFAHPLRMLRALHKSCFRPRNIILGLKNLGVLPKTILIYYMFSKKKISHIHAQFGSTTGTMAYILADLLNVPWSFTVHKGDISVNNLLKDKVKSAKFIRTTSSYWQKEVISIVGEELKDKVKMIYVGTEINRHFTKPKKNSKVIRVIVPARLAEEKGHEDLIEACCLLTRRKITNFRVDLYGRGPLRHRLEKLVRYNRLEGIIKFQGMVPNEALIDNYGYGGADMVVLPSLIEGMPTALIEAMSFGMPVISTNVNGTPELVRDGGLLVPPNNPEKLADAMQKLIQNKAMREQLGESARKIIIRDFDNHKIALQLIKLMN